MLWGRRRACSVQAIEFTYVSEVARFSASVCLANVGRGRACRRSHQHAAGRCDIATCCDGRALNLAVFGIFFECSAKASVAPRATPVTCASAVSRSTHTAETVVITSE